MRSGLMGAALAAVMVCGAVEKAEATFLDVGFLGTDNFAFGTFIEPDVPQIDNAGIIIQSFYFKQTGLHVDLDFSYIGASEDDHFSLTADVVADLSQVGPHELHGPVTCCNYIENGVSGYITGGYITLVPLSASFLIFGFALLALGAFGYGLKRKGVATV